MTQLSQLSRALHRRGIELSREGAVYRLRREGSEAQVLMPDTLPLPARAVEQLLAFAGVRTPAAEPAVHCTCALPDFHPGELAPVGSVVATEPDFVIPQSIGTDINCGMRLLATSLTLDEFRAAERDIARELTRSLLVAARDIPVPGAAFLALFDEGPEAFLETLKSEGLWGEADRGRLVKEITACIGLSSLRSASSFIPEALVDRSRPLLRDPQLGTVGSGNHFVEFGVLSEILEPSRAWHEGLKCDEVIVMIHSGSRLVGQYVGKRWMARAREAWPQGLAHPQSGLYGLSGSLAHEYLLAMGAAARYAWANRVSLTELVRAGLRAARGVDRSRLVVDVPHNVILTEDGLNVHRKGSTPAHTGQLALIPGSMGTASYLVEGLGHPEWLASCSHGAGRAVRRQRMRAKAHEENRTWHCLTLREAREREEAPSAYKPIEEVIAVQQAAWRIDPVASGQAAPCKDDAI